MPPNGVLCPQAVEAPLVKLPSPPTAYAGLEGGDQNGDVNYSASLRRVGRQVSTCKGVVSEILSEAAVQPSYVHGSPPSSDPPFYGAVFGALENTISAQPTILVTHSTSNLSLPCS